jgi:hypothetical protein
VARLGALRRQTWEGWDEHVSTEHAEMVEHDSGHAFCETIAAVLGRSRRSVLTFDGDTGEHTLAPASWRVDVGEPEGHTVRGLVDPEHEDLPPCCAAPTPTDS